MTNTKRILWGFIVTVILLVLCWYFLIHQALSPYWKARQEAVSIAESQEDFHSADQFYWHNDKESVFAITGKNSDNQDIMVIISGDKSNISTYLLDEIISEEEAIAQMIEEINPAKVLEARVTTSENDGPLWEVGFKDRNGRLGYYLISLIDGAWLKTIDNI